MTSETTSGPSPADKATEKGHGTTAAVKGAANETANKASDEVGDLKAAASSSLHKAAGQVEDLTAEGMEKLRELARQAVELAQEGADIAKAYVEEEPIKGMLIAAATGAVLMGLVIMVSRSDD